MGLAALPRRRAGELELREDASVQGSEAAVGDRVTFSRLLVLAAFGVALVLAVLILLTSTSILALTAVGWLFVALALYFGSLLVP